MSFDAVLSEVSSWSAEDRRRLVEALLQTLPDSGTDTLTPPQIAELQRRIEAHRSDPNSGIPWEAVRDDLRSRSR